MENSVRDVNSGGRPPLDLHRGTSGSGWRWDGCPEVARSLAALPPGPPRLHIQELALLGGCACTPERVAAAGSIHGPTENQPAPAQGCCCSQELEGWAPDEGPSGDTGAPIGLGLPSRRDAVGRTRPR
ncbi:hypothetical protein QTO34_010939 [Cnephaeus nilssonii]|uniref:Uncharacterized protein n=1 Tax=Cnephaeus nilssonii TaxID=3371016 RepID=A0AA40HDD7_CNENI|nr:hypothetical protein QTO34_010939 [Eptesicus nilssonii]